MACPIAWAIVQWSTAVSPRIPYMRTGPVVDIATTDCVSVSAISAHACKDVCTVWVEANVLFDIHSHNCLICPDTFMPILCTYVRTYVFVEPYVLQVKTQSWV